MSESQPAVAALLEDNARLREECRRLQDSLINALPMETRAEADRRNKQYAELCQRIAPHAATHEQVVEELNQLIEDHACWIP